MKSWGLMFGVPMALVGGSLAGLAIMEYENLPKEEIGERTLERFASFFYLCSTVGGLGIYLMKKEADRAYEIERGEKKKRILPDYLRFDVLERLPSRAFKDNARGYERKTRVARYFQRAC